MHKGIKIALWILSALTVLLVLFYISARFLFREQLVDYILKVEMEDRIDLLRQSGSYTEDSEQYHFTYVQDSCRAREIGQFFRLDTLLKNTSSDTWNKALTLARFVSGHIPHANQSVYPENVMRLTYGSTRKKSNRLSIAVFIPFCYMNYCFRKELSTVLLLAYLPTRSIQTAM